MKNLLLATSALVATAGFAAADVNISGSAEIGIVGGDAIETQFHTDVDVVFAMTGEADNGLTFGATVDLDESWQGDGNANGALNQDADDGGASFFVAYGGARLDVGDTDGALDAVMQEVNLAAGSINDAETGHAGFDGNSSMDGTGDGQIARFSYTFDSFTGHLSVEQGQTDTNANGYIDSADGIGNPIWGIGVRYSAELSNLTLGVGLGYQTQDGGDSEWGISIDTAFSNGLLMAVNYSEKDLGADHWGIGFGYSMNALSIGVNYGEYDNGNSGFGLAAAYDLGGGLTAQMGYGASDRGGVDSDAWSLGLAMSF